MADGKIFITLDDEELQKTLSDRTKIYTTEEYTEEKKEQYIQYLKDNKKDYPETQEELELIKAKLRVQKTYMLDNKYHSDYFYKKGTDKELIKAYDFLTGYYRARMLDDDRFDDPKNKQKLAIPQTKTEISYVSDYEQQTGANCWCCTAAALYNQFINVTYGSTKYINQYNVRGFVPNYRTYDEVRKELKIQKGSERDRDWERLYNQYRRGEEQFCGPNSYGIGSIVEVGDFFINKHRDMMINRMTFSSANDRGKQARDQASKALDELALNNQKAIFVEQVSKVLNTGNLVGILTYTSTGEKHYRTIKGINGKNETVKLMDSSPKSEYEVTIESLIKSSGGRSAEITWFEQIKQPEQMKQQFSNLEYSKEKGYAPKQIQTEQMLNAAQRDGVYVGKLRKDMNPNSMRIEWGAYVPKQPAAVR